jgi:hypothetical protein
LLPFFEHYNWGCECHTLVIMTLLPTHTWYKTSNKCHMTQDLKKLHPRLSKTFDLHTFHKNPSHSHDNLRRVSKSPLLHPFICRRSGTLDWCVTRATSADSSRLTHTILAHSSILLHYIIFQSFVTIGHLMWAFVTRWRQWMAQMLICAKKFHLWSTAKQQFTSY